MKTFRWLAVIAAVFVLAPGLADARVGGGGSAGSRGSKTDQAPPPTKTAPATKPVERSTTPPQQAQAPSNSTSSAVPPQNRGFMARNPFLSGLMGGMLGAGLFGMMFGGGFGGGLAGGAGMLGLLLQLVLIGGLAWLAVRLFRGWSAARAQPVGMAAGVAPAYLASPRMSEMPMARTAGPTLVGTASAPLAIAAGDFTAFETMLGDIQGAFSQGDLARLRSLVTPEMLGYFSEQLSDNASRGVENKIEAVKLEQGDLSEAWSESGTDYATVAMRFSMIDTTRRIADSAVVAGSTSERTEATEVWTFLRSRGGNWILSAIQQA